MKLVLRILWLLLGLVYRLVVLLLFERWIPFPEREEEPRRKAEQPKPVPRPSRPLRAPQPAPRPICRVDPALFDAQAIEPAPELVPLLESQHLQPKRTPRVPAAPTRKSLRALAHDPRALRDAVVLQAVFEPRRGRIR